ncbi:MAG: hypothetical protein WAW75_07910 [Gallionella sp.]
MINRFILFCYLAPFAIFAGLLMGLVLYMLTLAELDVAAGKVRYQQERDIGLMCRDDLVEKNRQCRKPKKGRVKK